MDNKSPNKYYRTENVYGNIYSILRSKKSMYWFLGQNVQNQFMDAGFSISKESNSI